MIPLAGHIYAPTSTTRTAQYRHIPPRSTKDRSESSDLGCSDYKGFAPDFRPYLNAPGSKISVTGTALTKYGRLGV